MGDAVAGIDSVIFAHGAANGDAAAAEAVDHGAVRNVLQTLSVRRVRIALMTSIGVTGRGNTHDWKRRSERLVRASGIAYTTVRPGWFDCNDADQLFITLLQGDTRHAGSPTDSVIARHQIARVLVDSIASDPADHVALELVAEHGPALGDLASAFAQLKKDLTGTLDGIDDQANTPIDVEPELVRRDLSAALGGSGQG